VMPTTTPAIKVEAVRRLGGQAILHGDTFDPAAEHAMQLVRAEGPVFIPPFDDPDVIVGQATVAMEVLRQHRGQLDAVFVPVGGGGLLAGVAGYVRRVAPEVKVIGVEPEDAACLKAALAAQAPVALKSVGIFADGVAVRQIGAEPWRVLEGRVDGLLTVTTDEICAAIKDIFDDTRSIAEPAGALALAGLKRHVETTGIRGQTLVAIDSGANMNFDRLRHVAERADLGERTEALFGVTIPERPGAFADFIEVLGSIAVTEFNYRYGDDDEAHIFVGVGLDDGDNTRERMRERIEAADLPVVDMTDNEIAKLHVRFMVGGRADAGSERIIRFEFPERPGALSRFLSAVAGRWNISLFHYRNHGAAYGRVLSGMQVPDEELPTFKRFLSELGYAYSDESDNPAYRLFLR
ncbi:MAG: threonine ammonia-lyase, biosynthetic, partial [Myxococcales bacterium]|nr:threonine ammonia-lyase, biosynthetic [Myxococcales bacterium]